LRTVNYSFLSSIIQGLQLHFNMSHLWPFSFHPTILSSNRFNWTTSSLRPDLVIRVLDLDVPLSVEETGCLNSFSQSHIHRWVPAVKASNSYDVDLTVAPPIIRDTGLRLWLAARTSSHRLEVFSEFHRQAKAQQ
jgi:hypothetical protein